MLTERLLVLLGASLLLWAVECRCPLFVFGHERTRHVLPNVALAVSTILMNIGFTWALRPGRLGLGLWPATSQSLGGLLRMPALGLALAVLLAPHASASPAARGAADVNRGVRLARIGQTNRALEAFARAARRSPKLPEAHLNHGLLLAQQGRH